MNGETCFSTKLFALVPCLSCTHSVLPFLLVPGSPSPHSTPCSVPLQPDPASHQLGHLPVLCAPTRLGQRVSHGWGEPDTQASVLRLDSGLSQSHAPVHPPPKTLHSPTLSRQHPFCFPHLPAGMNLGTSDCMSGNFAGLLYAQGPFAQLPHTHEQCGDAFIPDSAAQNTISMSVFRIHQIFSVRTPPAINTGGRVPHVPAQKTPTSPVCPLLACSCLRFVLGSSLSWGPSCHNTVQSDSYICVFFYGNINFFVIWGEEWCEHPISSTLGVPFHAKCGCVRGTCP